QQEFGEARGLLQGAIEIYEGVIDGNKEEDDEETVGYQNAKVARENMSVARRLLLNKGGIDLNINKIEIEGEGLYLPDFRIPFDTENFGGFTFRITSIERVQDWASTEVVVEGPQT
ncbi:MAG: hypothetical protein JSW17_02880, partial [Candidatus Omnitrophota bacterium]